MKVRTHRQGGPGRACPGHLGSPATDTGCRPSPVAICLPTGGLTTGHRRTSTDAAPWSSRGCKAARRRCVSWLRCGPPLSSRRCWDYRLLRNGPRTQARHAATGTTKNAGTCTRSPMQGLPGTGRKSRHTNNKDDRTAFLITTSEVARLDCSPAQPWTVLRAPYLRPSTPAASPCVLLRRTFESLLEQAAAGNGKDSPTHIAGDFVMRSVDVLLGYTRDVRFL